MKKAAVTILMLISLLAVTSCVKVEVNKDKYEPVAQISRQDADALVEEKLEETDIEFRYDKVKGVDGSSWYIYDVRSEGEILEEKLAVNCVSGDIKLYDPERDAISDYSDFVGYDERSDESIEWTGKYVSRDMGVVEIEEQDPASFEFKINPKKGDKVTGFAYKENAVEARSELNGVSILFNLDGKELVIGGEETGTEYDGTYVRK